MSLALVERKRRWALLEIANVVGRQIFVLSLTRLDDETGQLASQ